MNIQRPQQTPALFSKRLFKPIIYFFGLFLLAFSCWTDHFFGTVTLDQIILSFSFGSKGVLKSDPIFRNYFIIWCLLYTSLITIAFIFCEKYIIPYIVRCTSFNHTNIINRAFHILINNLHLLLLGFAIYYAAHQLNFYDYAKKKIIPQPDYIAQHYVDPAQTTFHLSHAKSLVLIYIEGLERTYSDTNLFGNNLLQSFDQFNKHAITFNSYKQAPGTNWTIAALVSTQCGVPLKSMSMYEGNRQGEKFNHFLPNATCLGDILAKHGYTNVFFGGARIKFSGKGKFFSDHHYSEVYGLGYWLAHGVDRKNTSPWGLFDDDLLTQAKFKLQELVKNNTLFNMTILTVDTHGPNGHLSKTCKKKGVNDFEGIVECTSQQVSDLVSFIIRQGWLDKMTVVIVGDHLAMKNPVSKKLEAYPNRTIFNMIISNNKMKKNRDEIVHFDMLPTILNAIGFQFKNDRLGLGYSAIAPSKNIILPKDRFAQMQQNVLNDSDLYNKLW